MMHPTSGVATPEKVSRISLLQAAQLRDHLDVAGLMGRIAGRVRSLRWPWDGPTARKSLAAIKKKKVLRTFSGSLQVCDKFIMLSRNIGTWMMKKGQPRLCCR